MADSKKVLFFGSDHAGLDLKKALMESVTAPWRVEDLGTHTTESTHYPEHAARVARKVAAGEGLGVLVCGSGIGVAISANKIPGVRAATVWDTTSARLCKLHNDTNVLCLGQRLVGVQVALDALHAWLETEFEGGRHQQRIDLIRSLESDAN